MNVSKLIYSNFSLYASAICLTVLYSSATARQSLSDSTIAQLELAVAGFKERYHSPSIAVAIVHKDRIIFSDARGYTDIENKIPATIDSRYQIQSVTKAFTATMFMQLCERGIINFMDPVSKKVPEFSSNATYLELATHNSGLPRNSPADIHFAKQVDRWLMQKKNEGPLRSADTANFIKSLAFVTRQYPSYDFLRQDTRHYSNLGYGLLGLALERAAGRDYEKYVLSNVCQPLGLNNTGFGTVGDSIAKGYYYQDDSIGFIRSPDYYPRSMAPAGGMYSTARDMARFISAQFDDDNKVISAKGRQMMQQLGIGWLRNHPYIQHEGSMLGARAEIVFHPELKIGWVILANITDFPFQRINQYIADLIVPLYQQKPIHDLQKYVGTYTLDGGYGMLQIYLSDGKLYSTYLQELLPNIPLQFSGDNSLTAKGKNGHDIRYEFIPDTENNIKALALNQLLWKKQEN